MQPTVDKSQTVRYDLVIESKVLPGRSRRTITVNGTSPGPVIWVELGQRVAVSVYNDIDPSDCDDGIKQNAMRNDSSCGTTIHWHGMSQEGSAFNDGVVGLSQCTIPYRQRIVYAFTPTRIGTFWYHGHFNDQYPNGRTLHLFILLTYYILLNRIVWAFSGPSTTCSSTLFALRLWRSSPRGQRRNYISR